MGGSGSEANYTRFIRNHERCMQRPRGGRKNQLPRHALRHLQDTAALQKPGAHAARKRVFDALVLG